IADQNSYGLLPHVSGNDLGAVIKYDFGTGMQSVVADSSSGLINHPAVATFLNGYLYIANCADGTNAFLVQIKLSTGQITRVNITDPNGIPTGFTYPTGLMPVPGDPTSLYVLDEGGYWYLPGQGRVWKEHFTDSNYVNATQTQFGLPFPNDPSNDY